MIANHWGLDALEIVDAENGDVLWEIPYERSVCVICRKAIVGRPNLELTIIDPLGDPTHVVRACSGRCARLAVADIWKKFRADPRPKTVVQHSLET